MDELVPKPVNVSVLQEILQENIEYNPWYEIITMFDYYRL